MAHPSLFVLEHQLVNYRRTWRGTVFSSLLLPILFFLGMGISVGAYVDRSGTLGLPYQDYIAPGLLASTALQVAIGEASWPVLGGLLWHRTYHAMRVTSLRPSDIMAGVIEYTLLRTALSAAGFLLVMAAFGTVHSLWGALAFPVCVLLGAAVATPMFAYTASVSHENMLVVVFRFGVIPMTLFAGVFFPVTSLPLVLRGLAYASPLWHGVELCRAATLGTPVAWSVAGHVGYLTAWAAIGLVLARHRFGRRLEDL
jgi:lipooligosaccharide transport system permease protein